MKLSALATKIARLRNQRGMTQKELAELCNVDIRTIQRIEAGEVAPRKHTLKQIANVLESEFNDLLNDLTEDPINVEKSFGKEIKFAVIAGVIYSLNCLAVVYDLITHSLSEPAHVTTTLIHIVSSIFFLRGFHFLGKQHNNEVMKVSCLLTMILLPLINMMELLKHFYFDLQMTTAVFTLLCLSGTFTGVGLIIETFKNKGSGRTSFYKWGGTILIVQSTMFLSSNFNLVSAGLIISLGSNLLLLHILRSATADFNKNNTQQPSQALV